MKIPKYRPWLGFTILGLALVAEFLPFPIRRTGLAFLLAFFFVWAWSQA